MVNIYKELESDLPDFKRPQHGDLTNWVSSNLMQMNQGVLLLNATLTVRKSEANSHSKYGWSKFTDSIIEYFQKQQHVVYMLWGGFAQKKAGNVNSRNNLVLKATHPSPLGANKGGWFGSKHFSKCNEYLIKHGVEPIEWRNL